MERHVGGAPPPQPRGRAASGLEAAHASEYFEHFLNATTLKNILGYHRSMCELLHLKPNAFPQFYPKLRASLGTWKAKALWKKFDSRISHKCYGKGKACQGSRVLVIGAGPCGLRTAIEAQLLGAKVVVVEKRDRLSRNNVLHLWPFVIEDLRALGAKKFFGKFCAGAIDHISIRQLQCVLLKVALLLGVEIHTEVSFERLREPDVIEKTGWRAEVVPKDHPVAQYEFDVIVGADGKRNTLQGFKRKEFRGKLAIAITANFINKKSEAEARVEEISGVAFIFNQKFFKDLQAQTRIDLENIVYYKDDTHYFVMTAKKASLLEKGVIKRDLSDTAKLLAAENVDREALQEYARQAADFSTNYQLPELAFAVNHYGQPDVAMFDFTSMYAAEYASRVIERRGHRLLTILVGDSLLEPFWPTGSGCARGFLSSLDAAWAIRGYCSGQMTALDVLAERESIYRLLAQTTPDNLNKDWKAYTLDPATRYPNLNKSVVTPLQTVCLYDTDAPESIEKMKRASLDSLGRHDHVTKKRRRGNVDVTVLITWLREQLRAYDDVTVTDLISVFRPGKALCALLHHYRPDLVDYAAAVANNDPAARNQLAIEILEKELGVTPFVTGEELTNSDDFLTLTTFLTQVFDTFRGEIPHVKHPRLMLPPRIERVYAGASNARDLATSLRKRCEHEVFDFTYQVAAAASRKGDGARAPPLTPADRHIIANLTAVKPATQTSRSGGGHFALGGHFRAAKRSTLGGNGRQTKMATVHDDVYDRVQNWISKHDFKQDRDSETGVTWDVSSDLTSITRTPQPQGEYADVKVEQRTDVVRCDGPFQSSNEELAELVKALKQQDQQQQQKMKKSLSKFSQFNMKSVSAPPANFSVIVEGEESELPESQKRSEFSFKSIKTSSNVNNATSRPSSRHKRHADAPIAQKPASLDRKQRKRRTLDRVGPSVEERQRTLEQIEANRQDRQEKRQQRRRLQTERFAKSMQMLRANRKSDDDSEAPFEDYSIFLYRRTAPAFEDRVRVLEKQFAYVPDYDAKMGGLKPLTNTNADEDIASKIRSLEDKWSNRQPAEKKPRDLMRAIGKIETSDWNIKQIEKKILENKMGKPSTLNADKERVPRWSREEFKARQTKMEKKHLDRQDSTETKFADIDRNIRQLDLKLREGTNRELGGNRVAQITEKLVKDAPQNMEKPEKLVAPKPVNLPVRSGSEFCHFCSKRVYLMERLSAEGRFFHHGCFKCQYCHTQLRLGSYMFDRDGQFGYRFYCIHHFGMQGELPRPTKIARKPSQKGSRDVANSPQKRSHQLSGVAGLDLLDRVETPERVEFANLSNDHVSSDRDEPLSQMDEDEWTDKNFGASANELDDSDDDFSSSLSDSDSDEEDAFDDAMEQPMTREGTMKLAQMVRNTHRKSRDSGSDGYSSSDQSSYYENTSDDSDSETATEDEEEIRARELRRREVLVQAPTLPTDTETDDTEVRKKSKSTSSDDAFKSAESDSDLNRNLTFTAKTHPQNALNKSATSDNVATLTQRHILSRTSLPEVRLDQPLLVTRRPPNKVNLPNEIKPKVAVNARKFDANKYFGQSEAQNKTRNAKFQSNKLQNSPNKPQNQNLLSNQLQSTSDKSQNRNLLSGKLQNSPDNLRSFSFEVNDSDLNDVDVYIEQLLSNERELQKPAAESPLSSSVEDLLDCLQREPLQADQKAEELLRWIEELEHQNPNVERHQKGFARKLSDDSKRFFENVLNPRVLARSRTETQIAQKKMLDSTVDVKSVLRKFESEPQKTTFSPQKLKNHSDSAKCFSETRKNVLPRARSLDQPDPTQKGKEISSNRSSDPQKEFLAQKTQKISLNQPISAKTLFLTQKEPFSSSQKENLAQKGDFGAEIGSNQSSDPQKNILAQKESFSSAQKENLAQKPKNQSDSVKSISEVQKTNFSCAQKSDFDEEISTNQSSDPQNEFLAQKTQKISLNQPVSAKTPFLAQKESSSSSQKENLAQKGDFGAEIGSNQSSDSQKKILAQKESSSSPQKENLAQKVTDSIKSFSEAQKTSLRAQKGDFAEEISSNQSSDPHKEFSAQKDNLAQKNYSKSYAAKMDFLTANTSERAQKEASESKSLEETVEELEKFVDETIESIGKRKWCGNVAVTSECSEKAQKMGGHDFSKAIESDSDSEEEKRVAVTQKALSTKQVVSPKFSPKFPPKFGRKDQDKDCCVQ